jgi:hypothetical protein
MIIIFHLYKQQTQVYIAYCTLNTTKVNEPGFQKYIATKTLSIQIIQQTILNSKFWQIKLLAPEFYI